jgi:hypothetical protein
MSSLVIIVGSFGVVFAYVLGLWLYKHHVEQQMLDFLARKWRDDRENFELWMYNLSIAVTKKEIEQSESHDI